jgi:hypothetical protein
MPPTGRRRAALVLTALCCHAFAPPILPRTRHNALNAKTKTKKKKKTAKGSPGGFGAAPKKTALTDEEKEARAIRGAVRDATSALQEARDQEGEAQAWLKLGAVLVRGGEFSEAERVFAAGAEKFEDEEMLRAAELTYRGHSLSYHRGPCEAWTNDVEFDEWVVGGPEQIEDHRTVSWKPEEPRAYASKGPLIPKEECDKVIALCEKRAEEMGGWQKARHAQAATTDMNVKDVPEILEWFNSRLKSTLFPMLASRFPDKIKDAADIRAHDAFIVKYDMEGQRALPLHVDESAFSFTIALNDMSDYEGGGTRFERARRPGTSDPWKEEVLNADAGGVVAFAGKARHGGMQITAGTRYIIPLFCFVDENRSGKAPGYIVEGLG